MTGPALPTRLKAAAAAGLRRHRPTRRLVDRRLEAANVHALRTTALFDPETYLLSNPDVAESGMDPYEHYVRYGSRERRSPGSRFDERDYLDRYPDVAMSGMAPLIHYLRHGRAHGRTMRPVLPRTSRTSHPDQLSLAAPGTSMTDGRLTIRCDMDGAPALRAIIDGPPDVLAQIEPRIEPFIPIALLMAGAAQRELTVEGPVDTDFLATLRLEYIPLLQQAFRFPSTNIEVNQSAPSSGDAGRRALNREFEPAALLFSGGIDSFYSLMRLRQIGYPLRLLVNINAGAHGGDRTCMTRRQERVAAIASEIGAELLTIDTNFHRVVRAPHSYVHPLRTLAPAYLLHGAVDGVFMSTGFALQEVGFELSVQGLAVVGATATHSMAWARMPVTEIGYDKSRYDKLQAIADEPMVQTGLDVCVDADHAANAGPGDAVNCGACYKCAGATLMLDHLGCLDRYATQFDVEHFAAHREQLLETVERRGGILDRDLLARLKGQSPPEAESLHIEPPRWATPSTNASSGPTTFKTPWITKQSPLQLHWWRKPGKRIGNAGDELSPLIVSRLSQREVEWAPVDACDLVAVGSVLDYCLEAGRDFPAYVWGAGFQFEGPAVRDTSFGVAALRGPLSAARLGIEGSVPTGDPALLVSLLMETWPKKDQVVGVIPHYAERDLPVIREWQKTTDTVISPLLPPMEFLQAVARCQLILSSSLHGLIVADSLSVPNRWVPLSDRVLGDRFKFRDYFTCLGRSDEPARLPWPGELDDTLLESLASGYQPQDLLQIQEALVLAFPQELLR